IPQGTPLAVPGARRRVSRLRSRARGQCTWDCRERRVDSSLLVSCDLQLTGRARPAAAHLAIDNGCSDDQEPLEDVLPLLIEAQEYRCVQDLNAEPCTHQRADERASPTEQARP